MSTPLQAIAPVGGTLTLSRDDLGSLAYVSIRNALKLTGDLSLTGCTVPAPATANLLIVQGTLASCLGQGPATIRLYLFEVATVLETTERHAILLFTSIASTLTAASFLAPFCTNASGASLPAEVAALQSLAFDPADPYLLYATLPYENASYVTPPFPPEEDATLPAALQRFVQTVKVELAQGYLFEATAQLQTSITIPPPAGSPAGTPPVAIDLSALLTALGLGSLVTAGFSLTGRLEFVRGSSILNLYHLINASAASFPLDPTITAVGIALDLGSGVIQVPRFLLQGTLHLAPSKPSAVSMVFYPAAEQLTVDFTHIPDFADLASQFTATSLATILGNALPDGAASALGSFEIVQIGLTIEVDGLSVSALNFSVTTEHPLALFDGITVQPALIASFTDPFDSFYTADIDVVGRWLFNSASLDTILVVQRGPAPAQDSLTFIARLGLGAGIDLVEVAESLFHKQIAGLPTLVLADFEVMAQRVGSGDGATESISMSLEVSSGWNLDGIDLEIDDLTLSVGFAKASAAASWEAENVSAQGTLQIGSLAFDLEADYEGSAKTWSFSGGTLPGEPVHLGDFMADLTKTLGLDLPTKFLEPFHAVNVTGCFLAYQSSSTGSATWKITVSVDFASGSSFHGIGLDDIVISFSREGTGTSFSFDATAPASQGAGDVAGYLKNSLGVDVSLPSALTDSSVKLQGLSAAYNAATGNYHFVAYLNFGANALAQLRIDVTTHTLNGVSTKDYVLAGFLIFNPGGTDEFVFQLDLVEAGAASELVASFQSGTASSGMKLSQLVKAIVPSPPPALDAFEIEIKDALFAHSSATSSAAAKSLFAVDMGAQVNLSKLQNLPLIGQELATASSLDLAFQVSYATGGYSVEEVQAINLTINDPSFRFPEVEIKADTLSLSTSMRVGGQGVIDMTVPVVANPDGSLSGNGGTNIPSTNPATSTTGGADGITWFPLNKAFGPLLLNRVGLAFDTGTTSIVGYLDGAITVGPLTFDVMGLDVSVPLKSADPSIPDRFIPTFGIQGLGLEYQNGPLTIAGALFKGTAAGVTEFDGFVTISTETLEIGAVGSFAEMNDGKKSLFVYAVLGEPLGGPAFFFVTGLAAGFGYNRKLLPPPISQVQNFPLVAEAMAPAPQPQAGDLSGARDYVARQLQLMEKDIIPAEGEYFLAAGVKFTSFELINGFLMAIVQFGNEFRIDILGLANATLPPDDNANPIAEAQLAVVAHYVPSEGSIWVQGQLTPNAYMLSQNCHLTGGFALACWDSGPYEGTFVLTIGGYAAGFQVPGYYPQVPRVGFNWQVSDNLNVKGGGYFALVPHALLAGGSLNAVWQSGNVKAWFLFGADFLIGWKPFHYEAEVYVDLGAELTIHFFGTHHVSIDASAALQIWGPEFGGHARITVKVIGIHFHFSIDFGASSAQLPPLAWDEFKSSFLPADDTQWLGVNIQGGLLRTVKGTLPDGTEADVWIVQRDTLNLGTSSVVPVKTVAFSLDGKPASVPAITPAITGIAPMNVAAIDTSAHCITITKVIGGSAASPASEATEQLKLVPTPKKIPSGMWGSTRTQPLNPAPGQDVLDAVAGFSLVPSKEAHEDPDALTVDRSSLAYETWQWNGFAWASGTGSFQPVAATWPAVEAAIQGTQAIRAAALGKLGFPDFKENFNQSIEVDTPTLPQLGTLIN
jgi:hypothetical protein